MFQAILLQKHQIYAIGPDKMILQKVISQKIKPLCGILCNLTSFKCEPDILYLEYQ